MFKVKKKEKKVKNNNQRKICKYKAVIFDLGDVYYRNGFKKTLRILSKKMGFSEKSIEKIFNRTYFKKIETNKITEKEFWKHFIKDFGDGVSVQEARKMIFDFFQPMPGMKKLVQDCRRKVKVGLLTNNGKDWFKKHNKNNRIVKNFDATVVSANIGIRKPVKEIYLFMAKKLNVKPRECIFFDDLMDNVKGAQKAGMNAIHFKSATRARKKLKKLNVL